MESSGMTGGREDEVRWGRVRGKEEEFGLGGMKSEVKKTFIYSRV